MPKPPLDKGDRMDNISAIWEPLFGLLEFRQCPGEIALPVIAVITKCKVSFRQVWVECERVIEGILSCRQPRRAGIGSYPVTRGLRTGEIGPSQDKIGIQLYGLLI